MCPVSDLVFKVACKLVISPILCVCVEGEKVEGIPVISLQLTELILLSISPFKILPWLADNAASVDVEVKASIIVIAPAPSPKVPSPNAHISFSPIRFSLTFKLPLSK